MVRVEGVEPSSQPWEGYIMAVIRHPLIIEWVWLDRAKLWKRRFVFYSSLRPGLPNNVISSNDW